MPKTKTETNVGAPSKETMRLLGTRRSVPAKALIAPGPTPEETDEILRLAARVPDHKAIEPFRFVVFEGAGKAAFARVLRDAPTAPKGKGAKAAGLHENAPLAIAVVASIDKKHEVPKWEQTLTVGAVCQNLLIAATARGFGAHWLTGWSAYDDTVNAALGLKKNERIAGFFFVGTPKVAPNDRKRPNMDEMVTRFEG